MKAGMNIAHAAEKESVFGHGQVNSGAKQDVPAQAAAYRYGDRAGNDRCRVRTEELTRDQLADPDDPAHPVHGQGKNINHVDQNIDERDAQGPDHQPERDVPLRPLDLFRGAVHGIPAVIGPELWDERPALDAEIVPSGKEDDRGGRHELPGRERVGISKDAYFQKKALGRQSGNKIAEKLGEPDSQGGYPASHAEPEKSPAIQVPGERSVGFADIDILAARPGIHRPELGTGQGPTEAEQAAATPDQQETSRR